MNKHEELEFEFDEEEDFAEAMTAVRRVLDQHIGGAKEDPCLMLRRVIGQLLVDASYKPLDLSCPNVGSSLDVYVAAKVGPLWPQLLELHKILVRSGATAESPFKANRYLMHGDRYGVAFANKKDWKSMAFQTQDYSYIVVLQYWPYWEKENGKSVEVPDYITHLRVCTRGENHRDVVRTGFHDLKFLSSEESVPLPEIEYSYSASPYFRHKDERDQGYLCTVTPGAPQEEVYYTEGVINDYKMLERVVADLGCHCECLKDYQDLVKKQRPGSKRRTQ